MHDINNRAWLCKKNCHVTVGSERVTVSKVIDKVYI